MSRSRTRKEVDVNYIKQINSAITYIIEGIEDTKLNMTLKNTLREISPDVFDFENFSNTLNGLNDAINILNAIKIIEQQNVMAECELKDLLIDILKHQKEAEWNNQIEVSLDKIHQAAKFDSEEEKLFCMKWLNGMPEYNYMTEYEGLIENYNSITNNILGGNFANACHLISKYIDEDNHKIITITDCLIEYAKCGRGEFGTVENFALMITDTLKQNIYHTNSTVISTIIANAQALLTEMTIDNNTNIKRSSTGEIRVIAFGKEDTMPPKINYTSTFFREKENTEADNTRNQPAQPASNKMKK